MGSKIESPIAVRVLVTAVFGRTQVWPTHNCIRVDEGTAQVHVPHLRIQLKSNCLGALQWIFIVFVENSKDKALAVLEKHEHSLLCRLEGIEFVRATPACWKCWQWASEWWASCFFSNTLSTPDGWSIFFLFDKYCGLVKSRISVVRSMSRLVADSSIKKNYRKAILLVCTLLILTTPCASQQENGQRMQELTKAHPDRHQSVWVLALQTRSTATFHANETAYSQESRHLKTKHVSVILQNPELPKARLSRHMSALRQARSNRFAQIESSMLRNLVILWRSFLDAYVMLLRQTHIWGVP